MKKLFRQAYCYNFQSNQDSILSKKNFNFQSIKILSNFWLGILNLKDAKKKLKNINEGLVPIAQYPKRLCNFCLSDEKKEIELVFTEQFF